MVFLREILLGHFLRIFRRDPEGGEHSSTKSWRTFGKNYGLKFAQAQHGLIACLSPSRQRLEDIDTFIIKLNDWMWHYCERGEYVFSVKDLTKKHVTREQLSVELAHMTADLLPEVGYLEALH